MVDDFPKHFPQHLSSPESYSTRELNNQVNPILIYQMKLAALIEN